MLKATIPVVALLLLLPAPATRLPAEQLAATAHQPLPSNPSDLWLVPSSADVTPAALTPFKALIDGAGKFADGDYAGALPLVSQGSLASTELRDYAAYYAAASQLRLSRSADARAHARGSASPSAATTESAPCGLRSTSAWKRARASAERERRSWLAAA